MSPLFGIRPEFAAAEHYGRELGLECVTLPNLVDPARVVVDRSHARYATFVNPSPEKGVYPFARIADQLGRIRPDIPLLVVEGRGTETTLANCGLDLREGGNIFIMAHTPDPRDFWSETKICILPSVCPECQPLVAIEAMMNGIPVVGSNRGGIPETLGNAGIVLPLPDRLSPHTSALPSPEEISPWVGALIKLWDDSELYAVHSQRALEEAKRWAVDLVEERIADFFGELAPH